ncbi:MAG: hypothetical protein M1814_001203 [Vezdaea aestivalis]|nr:MAG: hypothetical protein M1814_001203 [Vezdaea aestivalis]
MSEIAAQVQKPPIDRTPAWKRLGLELKSDKAVPTPQVQKSSKDRTPAWKRLGLGLEDFQEKSAATGNTGKKRRAPEDLNPPAASSKRYKSHQESSPDSPRVDSPATSSKPSKENKKSRGVQFSSDTKTEDAKSIKDLHRAWLESEKASDPSFDSESTPAALQVNQTTKDLVVKKKKKEKKRKEPHPKKTEAQTETEAPSEPHPALTYISQHLTDRSNWKFNKGKQNYILKHCLDIIAIPTSHNLALFTYLSSMTSPAAIARLREAILKMREEDRNKPKGEPKQVTPAEQGMSQFQQDAYDTALETWVAATLQSESRRHDRDQAFYAEILAAQDSAEEAKLSLTDRKRLEKRKRAEAILKLLGEGLEVDVKAKGGKDSVSKFGEKETKSGMEAPGERKSAKTVRKRKRRTADVDSSSESSSSGSGG